MPCGAEGGPGGFKLRGETTRITTGRLGLGRRNSPGEKYGVRGGDGESSGRRLHALLLGDWTWKGGSDEGDPLGGQWLSGGSGGGCVYRDERNKLYKEKNVTYNYSCGSLSL